MKRVFLDTNVLLDVLLHREPFLRDSAQVVDRGFRGEDAKQLHDALYAQAPDFEDMLQYNAAVAAGCEYIITRNEKHFPQESAHIMTPTQFLRDCPFEK